jgi:Protein of unknown function (DUF4232)
MKLLLAAVFAVAAASTSPPHAAPAACLGHQLAARAMFEGATGAAEGGITLRNASRHSCVLRGRAIVAFAADGAQLNARVTVGRGTDGRRRDRALVLRPRATAFVHVRWSNWCGPRYSAVTARLWMQSVEPRVRVRGTLAPPRCDDSATDSRVAVGPYEKRST